MDPEDVAQINKSLQHALRADPEHARRAIEQFGWRELLGDEPKVAVSTLFTLYGELLIPGSVLDQVLVQASRIAILPDDTRVVLPPLGDHRPASRCTGGGTILIDGVVQVGEGALLVPCLDDAGAPAFVVCDPVETVPVDSLDPAAGWVRVTATVHAQRVPHCASQDGDPPAVWQRMVAAGRRALAHELVGIGAAMAAMTVAHVCSREQFGQALGSFQAVKHQFADVHLWHEVAALSADAAWEDAGPESAALAKAAAIRFTRSARAVCQQLLGGMGFTWEHDFHRYLRRALTLEPLLGGASDLHAELGAAVRAGCVSNSLVAL